MFTSIYYKALVPPHRLEVPAEKVYSALRSFRQEKSYSFGVNHLLDMNELMTPLEVAKYLGLRPGTVAEWLPAGKLRGIKLQPCRQWRVNPEHLHVCEKQQEK